MSGDEQAFSGAIASPPPGGEVGRKRERPSIPSFAALRALIREDRQTNRTFWSPGFQALAAYRLGVWCEGIRPWVLRAPVRVVYNVLSLIARNVYGIDLSTKTIIGRRLWMAHPHGILIHSAAVIGDDCWIRQGVFIGSAGGVALVPRLGDRVKVGAGSMLLGQIRIGDDVTIGPNAVVMTNVPSGAIVASPQSRIVMPPPRRADGPTRSTRGLTDP
jgi:serine O-acetyltransferase